MTAQLETPPQSRVIKAGDGARAAVLNLVDLAAEAKRLVLDARVEAARIVEEARAAADAIRRQAAREPAARAQQPTADAAAHGPGESSSREAGELASKALAELLAAREEILHAARRQMLQFSLHLAEKIVGHVAAADTRAAQANLEKALALAGGGEIVVSVAPAQLEELRRQCGQYVGELSAGSVVRLEADEKIAPGGVKVTSRCGEIDATIETQLANVAASLLGQDHQPLLLDMFTNNAV